MDIVQERDAAIAERDTALMERKNAFAEREAAFLQRDVAYADRHVAWMERDAAVTALSMVRAGKDNRDVAAKLMQMMNMATVPLSVMEASLQSLPKGVHDIEQQGRSLGKKASPKKHKLSYQESKLGYSSPSKKQRKQKADHGIAGKGEKHRNDAMSDCNALLPFYDSGVIPIPYCSCTGANQQCYRWGKGGWQSACCTNFLSMYPLPMNPTKRSSRVPGRKMSGSAFKKLLGRLKADGVDITCPIDLKNYWAKHGTNRYATIK
ncbi:hypothetical protein KP509_06G050900 [Ceratopteris richardii]|nr:hypothetical protein KP509_06G050900 [Ceratopteris richardii]